LPQSLKGAKVPSQWERPTFSLAFSAWLPLAARQEPLTGLLDR
jgi:hypothetical protein